MKAALAKLIDRIAIAAAAARMPQPDGRDSRLEEVSRMLREFDFFPGEIPPVELKLDGAMTFRFPTPRPCEHVVNNVVPGRWHPCDKRWREKPVVLLLHGWNDILNHRYYFPRHARRLNELGLSAITLQLPWHFERRSRELGAWGNFLTADLMRTLQATQQAMMEIRSVINWLIAAGCPFVGIWGISMGAWLTGLTICHDSRIGGAILAVPVARLDRLIAEVAFCKTIRDTLQSRPVDLQRLNLVSNQPRIDRDKILLIEAVHDQFVAKDAVEDLWRAWDEPEIWRLQSGHLSMLWQPGLAERTAQWMAAKAGAHASKQRGCSPDRSASPDAPPG